MRGGLRSKIWTSGTRVKILEQAVARMVEAGDPLLIIEESTLPRARRQVFIQLDPHQAGSGVAERGKSS